MPNHDNTGGTHFPSGEMKLSTVHQEGDAVIEYENSIPGGSVTQRPHGTVGEGITMNAENVIAALKDQARIANDEANQFIGVDDPADTFYQGKRNGFLLAIKCVEQIREES